MTTLPSPEEVLKTLRTWLRENPNHPQYGEMDKIRKEIITRGQSAVEAHAAKLSALGLLPGAASNAGKPPTPEPRQQPVTTPLNRLNALQSDNPAAAKPQDSTPTPDRAEAVQRILSGARRKDYLLAYKNALVARNQGVLTVPDRGNALGFGENAAPEITKVIAKLEFALPMNLKNHAYAVLDTVQKIKSNNPQAALTQITQGLASLQDEDLPEAIRRQLEGSVLLLERERDEIQKLQAQAAAPIAEQQNETEWHSKQEAVQGLLDKKEYRAALGQLEEILLDVKDAAWRGEFETLQQQARKGWMKQVNEKVARAEKTEKRSPDDFEVQRRDWQAVLDLDPQHESARLFFKQRLPERENEYEYRTRLETFRTELRLAVDESAREPLPKLSNLLGECDALEIEMRDTLDTLHAEEILRALLKEWRTVKQEIEQGREKVRERLGVMSTLIASGEFEEAYKRGLKDARDGVGIVTDTANITGRGANAEVPVSEFLTRARSKLFEFLRAKAADRREDAAPYKITNPETAVRYLEEAVGFLSRKEREYLTRDDETALEPDRLPLERELEEARRNQRAYRQARDKIRKAQNIDDLEEIRRLASEARQEYPEHPDLPGLKEIEARIQTLQIAEQTELLRRAINQAAMQRQRGEYATALEILTTARSAAIRQIPVVPAGSTLEQILRELDQDERGIYVEQNQATQAEQAATTIQQLIKDGDLRGAQQQYDTLPDPIKQIPQVKRLGQDLTTLKSDDDKFQSGLRAYQSQRWQEAEGQFRAVTSTHPQYQQAQTLAQRAKAAQRCQEGDKAYTNNRFEDALAAYQAALGIFDDTPDPQDASVLLAQGTGVDSETRSLYQQCQRRVEELRPMQQATAEILPKLKEAQQLLKASKERLKQLSTLLARLEALPELQRAARILENEVEPRAAHSTKNSEFQSILGEVRRTWHDVYLKPSPQTGKSALAEAAEQNDFDVLLRARLRAEELYAAGLIAEREDQQTYAKLRLRYLACEYLSLKKQNPESPLDARGSADLPAWYLPAKRSNPREVDWRLVEDNRQQAKEIGDHNRLFVENQREEIYQQYREAARNRLEAELSKTTSTQVKQEKLCAALDTEPLNSEPDLLEQLLNLYWQQGQWQAAEAKIMQYAPEDARSLWKGLTKMQRAYAEGLIDDAHAEIARLKQIASSLPTEEEKDRTTQMITRYKESIENRLLEAWREQARTLEKSTAQDDWVEAAKNYARILTLDPQDSAAKSALKKLGDRLSPKITDFRQRALALSVERGQSLETAVMAASALRDEINNLRGAVEKMDFSVRDDKQAFEEAQKTANEKYVRWNTALSLQRKFEENLTAAKENPRPTRKNAEGSAYSGGWDFLEAEKVLQTWLQKLPSKEHLDLSWIYENLQRDLDDAKQNANALWKKIAELRAALDTEDFAAISAASEALHQIWQNIIAQDKDWDGLKSFIRHYDTTNSETLEEPLQLKAWAEKQAQNATKWEACLERVKQFHAAIETSKKNNPGLWNDDEQKRLDVGTLTEIAKLYKQIEEQYTQLESEINASPHTQLESQAKKPPEKCPPTNRRAKAAQAEALKLADIQFEKAKIQRFKKITDENLKRFNSDFQQLRNSMQNIENLQKKARGKPIASTPIETARALLKKIEEINPFHNNEEINRYKEILKKLPPPSK